uniref:hypothetical protein n=1 Tax=Methylomonas sp. SPW-1 TaxID=3438877 RepID=UPI00402B83FE
MSIKTLITTIVLTAAATSTGTYYLTTNGLQTSAQTAAVEMPTGDGTPEQVTVNQDVDKPITIVVKTEVAEKPHKPINTGHIRDLKQPALSVMPGP